MQPCCRTMRGLKKARAQSTYWASNKVKSCKRLFFDFYTASISLNAGNRKMSAVVIYEYHAWEIMHKGPCNILSVGGRVARRNCRRAESSISTRLEFFVTFFFKKKSNEGFSVREKLKNICLTDLLLFGIAPKSNKSRSLSGLAGSKGKFILLGISLRRTAPRKVRSGTVLNTKCLILVKAS